MPNDHDKQVLDAMVRLIELYRDSKVSIFDLTNQLENGASQLLGVSDPWQNTFMNYWSTIEIVNADMLEARRKRPTADEHRAVLQSLDQLYNLLQESKASQ